MRALLFETVTGKPVRDLQRSSWDYDTGILAPDKLNITVPGYTRQAKTLDLKSLLVKDKHSIALIDESVQSQRIVVAAGPIVTATPTEGERNSYDVEGRGIERLLNWRNIRLFPGWPLLNAGGFPTGTYDQNFTNLSYGTIMKRLISESEKFPGGALPINYEDDRAGIHERSAYAAVDGRKVLAAMDQLADLSDGVEYDFQPVIDEYDNISYNFRTGTDADRIISGSNVKVWNLGGRRPDIKGFIRSPDAGPVLTDAIFSGGKDGDTVMLARSLDHSPIAEGYPRAELWDSSHASVSIQSTLQSWADGSLSRIPDEISFDVKAKLARGVRHGDISQIAAQGHWDLPDDTYDVRVLSVGRSHSEPDWVHINLV